MKAQAAIFDLDGVIVDTARYHFLAWKRLAASLGITLTEAFNEQLKGVGRMESLQKILEFGKLSLPPEKMEELAEMKNEWFKEFISRMQPTEIFPEVPGLLQQLKHNGLCIALASSSKNARTVLQRLNLEGVFDAVTDGNDIANSKPHPEIFLTTALRLQLPPSNCVVIEDAAAGVEAALRAGMKVVGVGDSSVLQGAHRVVRQTKEITPALLKELLL
ncbi:MAG: beta-phosphoglucomutase [Cyclobacteriaceae bacterium]|nr:MAG: beta-phosphoglucomutase [Cyclobacteriaceae bacterium]